MAIPLVIRVDVFISSPGDLGEERQIVKRVVEKLNRSSLRNEYFFVPFLFEEEVPPEIGENAQLIVDRYMQVQNAYIMVSMFWTRMGTPFTIAGTNERYESGTQYEFVKGYEHFQKLNHPHILLYRKQKENPKANPTQKQKVEEFFDKFIGDPPMWKGLFAIYTEPAEFEDKLEEHIIKIIEAHPPQPEDFKRIEPPEFKEEPRRIDAAIPQETAVGQSTPVQVMICLPDSDGLEAFLPRQAGRDEIKKKDVQKGGLTIAFPVHRKSGKVMPTQVTIELETYDFKVKKNSSRVRLVAGSDSGQISFNVIPIKPAQKSQLIVKVKSMALNGSEVECGSVILSTRVKAAVDQVPIPLVWNLVSRALAAASVPAGGMGRVEIASGRSKKSRCKKKTGGSVSVGLAGNRIAPLKVPGGKELMQAALAGKASSFLAGKPTTSLSGSAVTSLAGKPGTSLLILNKVEIRQGTVIKGTDLEVYLITEPVTNLEKSVIRENPVGMIARENFPAYGLLASVVLAGTPSTPVTGAKLPPGDAVVIKAKNKIPKGTVIKDADLEETIISSPIKNPDMYVSREDLVGKVAKEIIEENRIVKKGMLEQRRKPA